MGCSPLLTGPAINGARLLSKQKRVREKTISYFAEVNISCRRRWCSLILRRQTVIVCFTVTPKTGGKKSDKRILAEACHTSKKSKLSAIIGALHASA
jgi:hypothetical protein